jgi:hypothetical protein
MTPMTLLWNGDSSRRKELQAKALRRRRSVIPTNDTLMTLMTLAPFCGLVGGLGARTLSPSAEGEAGSWQHSMVTGIYLRRHTRAN